MKINKSYLQQVIKEELTSVFEAVALPGGTLPEIEAKLKEDELVIDKAIKARFNRLLNYGISQNAAEMITTVPGWVPESGWRALLGQGDHTKFLEIRDQMQKILRQKVKNFKQFAKLKKLQSTVPAPGEWTPEIRAQAKALFKAGNKAYKEGDYALALEKFEEANRIAPHNDMVANIKRVKARMGRSGRGRTKASRQAILSKRVKRPIGSIQKNLRSYFNPSGPTWDGSETPDGKWGGETEAAIKAFQRDHMGDPTPDGLWGRGTEKAWKKLSRGKKLALQADPGLGEKEPTMVAKKGPSEIDKKIELAKQRHAKLYSDAVLALQSKPPADSSAEALRWYAREEQKKVRLANRQKDVVDTLIAQRDGRKSGGETAVAKTPARK